jgi:signal transduction histidine kinase
MNKKKYGTGLGLSIVKKILQKHSAQIYLSTEEKEGTIFFIDFLIGDF